MRYIFLIVAILYNLQYLIKSQVDYSCSPQYCPAKGNCPPFSCKGKDRLTLRNATQCGCCHRCVKELEENDECVLDMTGNIPATQCGPHLRCDYDALSRKGLCRPISQVQDGCERKRENLAKRMTETTIGEPIPECDDFGEHMAKQCKNGTLCHCVNTEGKRIFGSATYKNAKDMDCLCSRQFDEVNRKLSKLSDISHLSYFIDPVYYLRCKSNGNYEPFQFAGNMTYCVNTTSGELKDRPVQRRDVEQLECFKDKYPYVSDCLERYNNATAEIKILEEKGYMVVGYDVPKCDLDGTFAPVQCQNSHCYCVNKKGEKFKGTQVDRNDEYFAFTQNCNCVRELELIRELTGKDRDKVTELFSHYKCDKNGNYLPLQCSESACYCVDEEYGYLQGESVLKNNPTLIKDLPCYTNYTEPKRLDRIYANEFV